MRTPIVLAVTAVLAAACSATPDEAAAPAGPTPSATRPAATTPVRTPARTTPRPAPTPAPVTVEGVCPYADAGTIADTVGQHISRTTVTSTRPHPGCAFYRPNGEKAADISVSVLAGPAAAAARAARVPGAGANPVDSVGDGGAVAITGDGAVLAVHRGAALVVVRINQTVSLEAIEIAKLVVARI